MTKKMKVYLPRWVLGIILPVLAIVWGVMTWAALRTPSGRAEFGVLGWLGVTAILVLVAVMVWLMGTGRLPAYVIEVTDDESDDKAS